MILGSAREGWPKGFVPPPQHSDRVHPRQVRELCPDALHDLLSQGPVKGAADSFQGSTQGFPVKASQQEQDLEENTPADQSQRRWPQTEGAKSEVGANFSSSFCTDTRRQAVAITGPRYFVPDIQYAPSDVDPQDIIPFREEDFDSPPPAAEPDIVDTSPDAAETKQWQLHISSWNLAGSNEKRVKSLISNSPCCDVLAVQEYPKQKTTWQILKGDALHGVVYQHVLMYRALGIFYKCSVFHLRKKVATNKGLWVRLQHKPSGKHLWVGTTHLPNSAPREEVNRFAVEFFGACDARRELAIAAGDYNIQFGWCLTKNEEVAPAELSAKWGDLRQLAAEMGFSQLAPGSDQLHTPTFLSRKGNVANTQIDGMFQVNGSDKSMMVIEEGSRNEIGTDHDRITTSVWVKGKSSKRVQVGGPRVVAGTLPQIARIDHQTLAQLSSKYTKPAFLGPRFRASPATFALRSMAQHSKQADDWKKYLAALRREKEAWKGERLQKASSDWKTYKYFTKKKGAWGDEFMAKCDKDDPVKHIVEHFKGVFEDEGAGDIASMLSECTERLTEGKSYAPFTLEEVRKAVMMGKGGRAVGPDLVPVDILKCIANTPSSLLCLSTFFNDILHSGNTPVEWDVSIATLIPKLYPPGEAKHLRPIALASHVAKTFSRLLMARMEGVFLPKGPKQFACKHRQPAEMAWLTLQTAHLSREWQANCYMLKLDLCRAFDSVCRVKLARKVIEWADGCHAFEVRCLIRMLASSEVILSLPWEDVLLKANMGVKQGSTESPILFSRLVDDILCDIPSTDDGEILPGIGNDGCAFMDDIITWKSGVDSQRFVDELLPRLAAFGLQVQPKKSKLLCLRGPRNVKLQLGENVLEPIGEQEVFTVLNLPICQENTEMKILQTLIDKARAKFRGILPILTSKAPLKRRMDILNKVVHGVFAWVVGILFPTAGVQTALNHFQYSCIRKMMGLKRVAEETWVDGEARMLRVARAMVHRLQEQRWGDYAVIAYWKFTGHRVRGVSAPTPSAAASLSHFRGLPWWNQQQRSSMGNRHGRHFPFLMNSERRVARVTGSEGWRAAAMNRDQWSGLTQAWLRQEAVPWASSRQVALCN